MASAEHFGEHQVEEDNNETLSVYSEYELLSGSDSAYSGGMTQKHKDQVLNALRGAASLMTFLQRSNFFKLLTTVSSVAGPIFSVAIVIVNIVFMFIEVESPEMKQLKIEFTRLNNRLDQWSEEFAEMKRMIDWNAIQVGFGDHERSINTMSDHLNNLISCPPSIRSERREIFVSKYESSFLNTAEKLFNAMVNTDMIFSENLFRASQVYSEYHRGKVQHFMMGNFQLLLKAVEIQASYIQLRYNSTNATAFAQHLWEKKFLLLRDRMIEVDNATRDRWASQSQRDLDSLLAKHYALSNVDFEKVLFNFIAEKYDWRKWAIVTYKELSGWDNHAVYHCAGNNTGTFRFRSHGRNVQMASVEPLPTEETAERLRVVVRLLDYYEKNGIPHGGSSDYAKVVMQRLMQAQNIHCDPQQYIGVVQWGSDVWFYKIEEHLGYRKLCVQGGYCFNVFILV